VIEKFEEYDKAKQAKNYQAGIDPIKEKYESLKNILLNVLKFKKIGEGAYREVYGRYDAPFIIKLERISSVNPNGSISSGTNRSEYQTYFNYGSDFQPRNDLFPKIYGYDKIDDVWIIFEKVNTFDQNDTQVLKKMFKPLFDLMKKIIEIIDTDPSLKIPLSINNPYVQPQQKTGYRDVSANGFKDPFKVNPYVQNMFMDIGSIGGPQLFDHFLSIVEELSFEGVIDIKSKFKDVLLDYSIKNFLKEPLVITKYNPQLIPLLKNTILKNFDYNIEPTPDVVHLFNFLKNKEIEDIHFYNVGYRDLKNNPKEPWKNFVILDFGEFGLHS